MVTQSVKSGILSSVAKKGTELQKIPQSWALTPVDGSKKPYRAKWQSEPPLKREKILSEIQSGSAKGYGLRTGKISNGIAAVDFDGQSAWELAKKLSGGELPDTISFTSNRPGRHQRLYLIPEEYWEGIKTTKLKTGATGDDGKPEQLEFRWDGCQSVLPPSVHPTTGQYTWIKSPQEIEIAIAPMWVIEQMLKPQPKPAPQLKQPSSSKWSSVDWALSYLNALSPYRADDYEDWLAVGMALHSADDSLLTEWDNWSQQSPKYTPGCCEKKWKSFKGDKKSLGTLGYMAKQDGWSNPFKKDEPSKDKNNSTESKIISFPGFEPLNIEQVRKEIEKLIKKGISGSKLTAELNRLALASQIYIVELRKLYYEQLGEYDLESDRSANKSETESLIAITEQRLNLSDYLPSSLSRPMTQWCQWLNLLPQVALTALLSGASSLHKVGTELVIHRNQNFRIPPGLYAALVSISGQKKSPIFNNIIRYPLNNLRQSKLDAYQAATEDYEAALAQWEQDGKKGKKPDKPKEPTLYYFTNATGESIPIQASKSPQKALLALIDELAGYFNSSNAYRSGRGSDKQDLLSYFDGMGQTILRAGGVKVDVPKIYLSIFGTIQPEIIKKHMEDCSDPDGNWARFLFVNQPPQAAVLSDDDGMAVQISERITGYYRAIDQLPEMEYRLSKEAFKRYQKVYNQLERMRVTHPKSGMAAVYSKMEGYIGRLALNLHVLWELDAGKDCPGEEIPLHIMEMAIELAKFYMGQIKLIHANCDDESIPTHILKLVELSKRYEANGKDPWIKAKTYSECFEKKNRPKAPQAREWMLEAVALGQGQTRGEGNQLEYYWRSDNNIPTSVPLGEELGRLGRVEEEVRKDVPLGLSIDMSGIQLSTGKIRKEFPNFSSYELEGQEKEEEVEKNLLEGGYSSKASPNAQATELVSDTATGNSFLNPSYTSPDLPNEALSEQLQADQNQDDVPVTSDTGTHPNGDNDRAEALRYIASVMPKIAEDWLVRDLDDLRAGLSSSDLNEVCKCLSPELRSRIKHMVLAQSKAQIKFGEYDGSIEAKSKEGKFFIAWSNVSYRLATQNDFQLPGVLEIYDFELARS